MSVMQRRAALSYLSSSSTYAPGTSTSGCPSVSTKFLVLDYDELGPGVEYSLLTSLSPTNNSSNLVISHKTGRAAEADLRQTTFAKSNGATVEQRLIDRVNVAGDTSDTGEPAHHKHNSSALAKTDPHLLTRTDPLRKAVMGLVNLRRSLPTSRPA